MIKLYYTCSYTIDKSRFLTGKARKGDYSSTIVAMESDFDSSKNEHKNGPWSTISSHFSVSTRRDIMLIALFSMVHRHREIVLTCLILIDRCYGGETMDIGTIQAVVKKVANEYPIKRITLFGSRANNTNRENSDVDLIIEFTAPVSLITLSSVRLRLEELLKLNVDVVHGPVRAEDLLDIDKEVELYVA